jgi:hypothetical protein
MKRFLIAGLLALTVTAASQQQASAWCKFTISSNFNLCWETGGHCWSWGMSSYSPPCPYQGGYAYPAVYGGYDTGSHAAAYPAYDYGAYAYSGYGVPPQATQPSPPQIPAAAQGYTQQVGYQFYPQYGGGQVPNYWYGR